MIRLIKLFLDYLTLKNSYFGILIWNCPLDLVLAKFHFIAPCNFISDYACKKLQRKTKPYVWSILISKQQKTFLFILCCLIRIVVSIFNIFLLKVFVMSLLYNQEKQALWHFRTILFFLFIWCRISCWLKLGSENQ